MYRAGIQYNNTTIQNFTINPKFDIFKIYDIIYVLTSRNNVTVPVIGALVIIDLTTGQKGATGLGPRPRTYLISEIRELILAGKLTHEQALNLNYRKRGLASIERYWRDYELSLYQAVSEGDKEIAEQLIGHPLTELELQYLEAKQAELRADRIWILKRSITRLDPQDRDYDKDVREIEAEINGL